MNEIKLVRNDEINVVLLLVKKATENMIAMDIL